MSIEVQAPSHSRFATRVETNGTGVTYITASTALLADIAQDARTLAELHGELLTAELQEARDKAIRAAVLIGAGAVGLAVGALFVLVGLVGLTAWLFPTLPAWAAWLIWGGGLALAAYLVLQTGKGTAAEIPAYPRRTLHSLQESVTWLLNGRK